MGYAQALLGRDYRREQESLQRKAKKKGLWGSVGRTLGGIAATALTGGAAAPWAAGLMAGAGTAIGGAIGAGASGEKLTGGTFMQKERAGLEKQLGAFGEANIAGGLKAGLMAGIGQAGKLRKAGKAGKGKGLDFKGSFVGKGIEKGKAAGIAAKATEESAAMRGFQGQYEAEQLRGAQAGYEALEKGLGRQQRFTYGGGGAGIDPSIRKTGNEFIDESLGGYKAPGIGEGTGKTLDQILQGQSVSATAADKRASIIGYGGGGTGIDPNIKSTGNEFIDRQLGGVGGGAPTLQDDSLDAILQRQSAAATPLERRGIRGPGRYQEWQQRQQEGQRVYEQYGTYDRSIKAPAHRWQKIMELE